MPILDTLVFGGRGSLPMLAVGLLALVQPAPSGGRRVLAGGVILALGLTSLGLIGAAPAGGEPDVSTVIGVATVLLGVLVAVVESTRALRGRLPMTAVAVAGAALAVLLLTVLGSLQLLDSVSASLRALSAAGLIAVTLLLLTFLGRALRFGAVVRWLDQRLLPRHVAFSSWSSEARTLLVAHVVGACLVLVAPHLDLVLGGALLALATGVMFERSLGSIRNWPVPVAAAVPALGIAWFLLDRVAGDQSRFLEALQGAPYSPAFEVIASALLLIVALALMGAWPFHGSLRGPFTPVVGALLVVRVIAPILPEGLSHWQPLTYPLAVITAWHAALAGRDEESLVAFGLLGALSGDGSGGWAGVGLAGGGTLMRLRQALLAEGLQLNVRGRVVLGVALLAGCLLSIPLLRAALGAQVFYTVIATLGAGAALGTSRVPDR